MCLVGVKAANAVWVRRKQDQDVLSVNLMLLVSFQVTPPPRPNCSWATCAYFPPLCLFPSALSQLGDGRKCEASGGERENRTALQLPQQKWRQEPGFLSVTRNLWKTWRLGNSIIWAFSWKENMDNWEKWKKRKAYLKKDRTYSLVNFYGG